MEWRRIPQQGGDEISDRSTPFCSEPAAAGFPKASRCMCCALSLSASFLALTVLAGLQRSLITEEHSPHARLMGTPPDRQYLMRYYREGPTKDIDSVGRKYLMGYFREGPTKHIKSVGMMIRVAERINRILVEPCYTIKGILGPCVVEKYQIPFCTAFDCGQPIFEKMIRFSAFPRRQMSNRTWIASLAWGYNPRGNFVMDGTEYVPDKAVDLIFIKNIIQGTFGQVPNLRYAYNKSYVRAVIQEAAHPRPYAVVQWRSELNINHPANYDNYIACARQFRKQIEFYNVKYPHIYVIWDARIQAKYNWFHLNLVLPRKYREDAHDIVMKPLNSSKLWRLTPTGNIVHDMIFDHVVASRGDLLAQCLRGWCQRCSFKSGFTARTTLLFTRENPHGELIGSWV